MILSFFPAILRSLGAGDEGKNSGIAPRLGIKNKDIKTLRY